MTATKNQPHTISKEQQGGERLHRKADGRWTTDHTRAVIYPTHDAAWKALVAIYGQAEVGYGKPWPYRLGSDSEPRRLARGDGNAWMDAQGTTHDAE